MEIEWLQIDGLSPVQGTPSIVMQQVGDANGFPCWKSTQISLFLFFFRGEWIIHHECIRENLGQPYFPPRRPLACEAFFPTLDCCPIGSHLWMVQRRKKWVARTLTVRSLVEEPLLEARQRLAAGKLLHHRLAACVALSDADVAERAAALCLPAQLERRRYRRLEEYRARQDQQVSAGTVLLVGDAEAEYVAWRRKRAGPNEHVLRYLTGMMMGETINVKLTMVAWYVLRPPLGPGQDFQPLPQVCAADGGTAPETEPDWYEAVSKVALSRGVEPSTREIGVVQKGDFILVRERRVAAGGTPRVRCAFGWASSSDLRLFAPIRNVNAPRDLTPADQDQSLTDGKVRATALFSWDAEASTGDLVFGQGDLIVVVSDAPGQGWMTGSIDGRVGIFPSNYVEVNESSRTRDAAAEREPKGEAECPRLEIIMARLEEELYTQAPLVLTKTDCRNLLDKCSRRVDWALSALHLRTHHRQVEWDTCQAITRCSGDHELASWMLREWRMLSLLGANVVMLSSCVAILMLIAHADEETNLMWTCGFANIIALAAVDLYFFVFEQRAFLGSKPPRHARKALERAEIDRPGPRAFQTVVAKDFMASLLAGGDDDDDDLDSDQADADLGVLKFNTDVALSANVLVNLEVTVSETRVELRSVGEIVGRIEMRWLEDPDALTVAQDDGHFLTVKPEFFQLQDRVRNGRAVHLRTVEPAATVSNLIRRRQEPIQVPVPAEMSRHHCEWLRPLILRWVPAYACLSIYISLTATEYAPYFAGGPYAIFLLFLLGVARIPFLGMYPDRAVLINVLRGEFDISMGYAHSLSPARAIWFGSPAAWILTFALILRGTMLTMPSSGFCLLDTTTVSGYSIVPQNNTGSVERDFGGLSEDYISFLGTEEEKRVQEETRRSEPPVFDDYAGDELEGIFAFDHDGIRQIRTTPPGSETCGGSMEGHVGAWMDTLEMAGPCLHDDGTTSCRLPTLWEGPVPRKLCLQTSADEPCGAHLPAVVQRCAQGHYRYKLPTPEATVIKSGQLAVSHGGANLTYENRTVGRPAIVVGTMSGDVHIEFISQEWINRAPEGEEADVVVSDGEGSEPQQVLLIRVRGSKFVAPQQTCVAPPAPARGTRPDREPAVVLWAHTEGEPQRCAVAARVGRGSYGSVADARAVCERSTECQAISGPGACDGPGPWMLCSEATGGDAGGGLNRPSCMHQKPAQVVATPCLREPFAGNRSQHATGATSLAAPSLAARPQRNIVCGPRTAGSAYLMYTEESVASRFGATAAGTKRAGRPRTPRPQLVRSVNIPATHRAPLFTSNAEFSDHFVCVAYEEGVGWMYDSGSAAHGAAGLLNVSSITFTPSASDVLVARVEYGRVYRADYCLEGTPHTRVRRNSTGGEIIYDHWSDPSVVYPVVWFVMAVVLICDDPFYWGCHACQATGPHGLWCV